LVPIRRKDVDARDKRGHDGLSRYAAEWNVASQNSTPTSVADRQATRQPRRVWAASNVRENRSGTEHVLIMASRAPSDEISRTTQSRSDPCIDILAHL
jgi:hypothetical protein